MTDGSSWWADRSVQWLLLARGLSRTAISLLLTVLFKQVFDLTNDPLSIGIVGLIQFVPAVVLVMASGYLADRFDRRHVVALMNLLRSGCAVGFAFYTVTIDGSSSAVWPLYAITAVFGTIDAIAIPAQHALSPLVVERSRLPNLVAAGAVTMLVSTIVGPIAGGYLYAADPASAYVAAAVLFLASVPPMLAVRYAIAPTRVTDRPSLAMALEGLRFIWRSPIVFGAIGLDMVAVLFGGAIALLPVIATERLGVGDVAYGWLRAAPGIGGALTGLFLAVRPVRRRVGSILLVVVAAFGLFHVVLGLTTNYAVAFAALMGGAAADMVSMTIRATLTPVATPDHQLGRVSAVESIFIGASNELGAFESGVAARWLGVPVAVAGGGLITVAVAGLFAVFVPTLRRLDTYDQIQPDGTVRFAPEPS